MDAPDDVLPRAEWISTDPPPIRMVFRRDGSGYYEREGAPGTRPVRENLLFRLEGGRLHLKFARARGWTEVAFSLEEVDPAADRTGRFRLEFARDPHAWAMEDRPSPALVLVSDTGPALPT